VPVPVAAVVVELEPLPVVELVVDVVSLSCEVPDPTSGLDVWLLEQDNNPKTNQNEARVCSIAMQYLHGQLRTE
jgi:hypothetical protein